MQTFTFDTLNETKILNIKCAPLQLCLQGRSACCAQVGSFGAKEPRLEIAIDWYLEEISKIWIQYESLCDNIVSQILHLRTSCACKCF